MNETKQISLVDVLISPYAAGIEARRIVEEMSARPSKSSGPLRKRLEAIFRYVAFNLTQDQKNLYATGYSDANRVYAPI